MSVNARACEAQGTDYLRRLEWTQCKSCIRLTDNLPAALALSNVGQNAAMVHGALAPPVCLSVICFLSVCGTDTTRAA